MQKLQEARDKLAAEIEAKRHQLAGLDQALALLREGEDAESGKRSRTATKSVTLALLQEYREAGLSSSEVVEIAKQRGQELDRPSVSSLLSRLKREGTLVLSGSKYRLASVRETQAAAATLPPHAIATNDKADMIGRNMQIAAESIKSVSAAAVGATKIRFSDGTFGVRTADGTVRRVVS